MTDNKTSPQPVDESPAMEARSQTGPGQDESAGQAPKKTGSRRRRSLPVRLLRLTGLLLGTVLVVCLLVTGGLFAALQTDKGQAFLQDRLNALLADAGIEIRDLSGFLPFSIQASVRLSDADGLWLEAEQCRLALDIEDMPKALGLSVQADRGHLWRVPQGKTETPSEPSAPLDIQGLLDSVATATAVLPDWVPGLRLRTLSVGSFQVERGVYEAGWQGGTDSTLPDGTGESPAADAARTADRTAAPAAGTEDVPAAPQARAILCALRGEASVLPDAGLGWKEPSTDAALSLVVLPHTGAGAGDIRHLGSTAAVPGATDLPVPRIFGDIALDLATVDLGLTGSLAAPQLTLETRLGALEAAGSRLVHPVLRLVVPHTALPGLREGQKAPLHLAVHTLVRAIPLSTRLTAEIGLRDNAPDIRLLPLVTCPGIDLSGDLATVLPASLLAGTAQPPAGAAGEEVPAAEDRTAPAQATAASLEDSLPPLNGTLALQIRDFALLSFLQPDMAAGGSLDLALALSKEEKTPQALGLSLRGSNLSFRQKGSELAALAKLALETSLSGVTPETLTGSTSLDIEALRAPGLAPTTLAFRAGGTPQALRFDLSSRGGIESLLQVSLAPQAKTVGLQALRLRLPTQGCGLQLARPASISYGDTIRVQGLEIAMQPGGHLSLTGAYGSESLQLSGQLKNLRTDAWSKLVPGLPKGLVEASVALRGSLDRPDGQVAVNLRDFVLPVTGLPPVSARLDATLASTAGGGNVKAVVSLDEKTRQALGIDSFRCEAGLPLKREGSSLAPNLDGPLTGSLACAGNVTKLWSLARQPNMRFSGKLALDAKVSGTARSPRATATLTLGNSSFSDVQYGIQVRDIALKADVLYPGSLEQGSAKFELTARDGRRKSGTLRVTGNSDLTGNKLGVHATLTRFSPLRRRDIRAMLSGDVRVAGPATAPKITGTLGVDRGRVALEALEIPASVTTLPLSEGPKERILADRKAKIRAQAQAAKAAPAIPGSLDLGLTVRRFFVAGYGFDSEWKADMKVAGSPGSPEILGSVEAVRGSLDLLNRQFHLEEGTVSFAGGLEPLLNIKMITTVDAIEAAINVGGSTRKLDLTLSSTPSMQQTDILSYMLFGKPSNELSQFELLRLGATAASFAAFGSSGSSVTSFAKKVTGLDVLNVSQDDNSNTKLEMGRYVMDNLYVGVEQGMGEESETSAVIQLELGPRTSATMRTGGDNTSVGLKWKMDY